MKKNDFVRYNALWLRTMAPKDQVLAMAKQVGIVKEAKIVGSMMGVEVQFGRKVVLVHEAILEVVGNVHANK